jgi:acetate---CoA ligase (ADP-forming)
VTVSPGTLSRPAGGRARLRDGSTVTIRRCRVEDEPALEAFLEGLCVESRRLRFFSGAVDAPRSAHLVSGVGAHRIGLVAFDQRGEVVGHTLCVEVERGRGEVAVAVADHLHGRGLGTILIVRLAEIAEQEGVDELFAAVLPENHAMLELFRDGFDAHIALRDGIETVSFPAAAWRLARERYE